MASEGMGPEGSLPLDLLERGDPAFVDALRAVHDADALANFADAWFDDRRPASRRLMRDYFDRPLNAFRHEGLIKRLFKRAEAGGDDQIMAWSLVLFDRSVRRARGRRPRTTMPRDRLVQVRRSGPGLVPDWASLLGLDWEGEFNKADIRELPAVLERLKTFRLFSPATRGYLRRRAWRYFRRLGRDHPDRYVAAACEALALYRDEDAADGLALVDNWGLVHFLFHHCPALEARPDGWTVRPGRSLAELAPAPIHEGLWKGAPGAVVGLLATARSRAVRRWAIRRVEADLAWHAPALAADGWVDLLRHDDPGVVVLAAEVLDRFEGLEAMGVDRWLALAGSTHPEALEALCELIGRHVDPGRVTLEQAARLAGLRPLPLARLGLSWLETKAPRDPAEVRAALALVEAESEPLRPSILRWLRGALAGSPGLEASTILKFLDSRHADVRLEGWAWFRSEPKARDDVESWRQLVQSPYDDVRLALVAELESRPALADPAAPARALDAESLRRLWAGVLLDVHRGGRAKPLVVRQLLARLEAEPGDAPALLPLLGVALRSARGPERRAGLVAIVRLVAARAEVGPLVRSSFPELQFS